MLTALRSSMCRPLLAAAPCTRAAAALSDAASGGAAGSVLLFPGQGAQRVGMGADLYETFAEAKDVFDEADEALGFRLSTLMFSGDEEELKLTKNTQPALLAHSVASLRVCQAKGVLPEDIKAVMGHSLGEYSALVAAGSLQLADALRLVRARGEAMQTAVPAGEGGMAALMPADEEKAAAIAALGASAGVCEVANINSPAQVVISGALPAVKQALAEAKAAKMRVRGILLPVSAPFHCSLMAPAAEAMAPVLEEVSIAAPALPLINNVDATVVTDADVVRDGLYRQIAAPVRWLHSMKLAVEEMGVTSACELGTGAALAGMLRAYDKSVPCTSVGDVASVEAAMAAAEEAAAA